MNERFHYFITDADQELPIKELLKRRLGISSRLIRKLKQGDWVTLNGKPAKLFEKGSTGDKVAFTIPEETSGFEPEAIFIDVLYEDQDLLAINKQPGYVVHPTKGHPGHTIANGLMKRMLDRGESYKIRFINRLDMDTSGVLLIGKNSHTQDDVSKQGSRGSVRKEYIAVVKGVPDQAEGRIDLPVGKPIDDKVMRAVIPEGDASVTRYRLLENFGKKYSLLSLRLETGRTHQIRVHLSHLGHPVVGDHLYGGSDVRKIERQALHAALLEFDHPVTGKRLTIEAPLPSDMEALLQQLRAEYTK